MVEHNGGIYGVCWQQLGRGCALFGLRRVPRVLELADMPTERLLELRAATEGAVEHGGAPRGIYGVAGSSSGVAAPSLGSCELQGFWSWRTGQQRGSPGAEGSNGGFEATGAA